MAAVLLAAGQGTRMHSAVPKVLHPLLGKPMIYYSLEVSRQAAASRPYVVVGHSADQVRLALGDSAIIILQEPQLGTGHAVLQAAPVLGDQFDLVLVTYADMPLLSLETLQHLIQTQQRHAGPITMLTVTDQAARGFGRVVRDTTGVVTAIVEEAQATPHQLAIDELNVGVYCFTAAWLRQALPRIPLSSKGEYYLTDLVGLAASDGLSVQAVAVESADETIGINTRVHLAEAEAILRQRLNRHWMLAGVTLVDPASTTIEPGVEIGTDTVVWPNTYLQGDTTIGQGCVLGPNTVVSDCRIGSHCKIVASVVEKAIMEDGADIGPFGHLRKGAHLGQGVHLGNFGEVKDSYLGAGTKMGHFSYLGNATIGEKVNIGAGTITCNYDGVNKNPTEVGDGAFIGSDTMLVAPVKIGEGARTGAGAVVTHDVPAHTLVIGVPARAIRKLDDRG